MQSTVFRSFVLLSCTFLGLICGTLYLYSSYSPQLALRLHYLATGSSSIALCGSLGTAVVGPLAGVVVDRNGYSAALFIGGVSIVLGYLLLKWQYDAPYSNLPFSCFDLFLVGCGSTFINSLCLKCCAVTFPSIRGVATSLPLALYGLSAMFYSVVASVFYAGDTLGFLYFLIVSLIIIFLICCPAIVQCDKRRFSKRQRTEVVEMTTFGPEPVDPLELQMHGVHHNSEISGMKLLRTPRFWLLFIITGALASLGQMYIYSVGYMVKALVIFSYELPPDVLEKVHAIDILVQNQQQLQVSLLSVTNCVGRLAAGIVGDIVNKNLRKPRSWLLFLPSFGLILTQVMALNISHYEQLGPTSILTGFFYGFTFCIMPIIVGDVFGMENFSQNWGLVSLAPVAPSFYFTNLFGKVYDLRSSTGESGYTSCLLGGGCYDLVFKLSLGVGILSLLAVAMFNFGERYVASLNLYERRRSSVSVK